MKNTIVSGIQPTGGLHIGNYLGAIKYWLKLQKANRCFFFVADYHAMTVEYSPQERHAEVLSLMTDLLALGLDSKKATVFLQSDVPEVTELAWIFSTLTPVAFLERMIEYKEKISRGEPANVGLFTYPVLMAADILLYGGDQVPVGVDQSQHVELSRDIARFFNHRFGTTFKEPEALFTATPKVMSLLEPTKKMSKSLGPDHYLAISDSPEVLRAKIRRAVTDVGPQKKEQGSIDAEMSLGVANLFTLLKEFGDGKTLKKFEAAHVDGSIRYLELKDAVAEAVIDFFADYRAKKIKLAQTPAKVRAVFAAGAKKARAAARETMKLVRQRVGLR